MISKESYEEKHIRNIQEKTHRDPNLIERVIYAFGLLEALVKVDLPFIFKGGTCLMLLLDKPHRFSTDIDIVVDPKINIDEYIIKISKIFPFAKQEEDIREEKKGIVKRHFKFIYESPINKKSLNILLDVLFEKNYYQTTVEKNINMDMLICDEKILKVTIPTVDCLLADKLTAFAPHTIGIPIGKNKDMEVMKQMYDIITLIDVFEDINKVRSTYEIICKTEIEYRGINTTIQNCLIDTFEASLCIASRGKIGLEDYKYYLKGINELHDHIFIENYSAEIAAVRAPKIMYMCMCLLNKKEYEKNKEPDMYISKKIQNIELKYLSYLRKVDSLAYAYVIMTDELYSQWKK